MLTRERLLELLDFSEAEGLFRWKKPTSMRVRVGDVAGKFGTVRILGKTYTVAHLLYLVRNGELPRQGVMAGFGFVDLDGEQWQPISDFHGYEVSNLGRVRSLPRAVLQKNGTVRVHEGKLLEAAPNVNTGYPQVTLYKTGSRCRWRNVHALVAAAFLPERKDGEEVRHRDGNRLNCEASNLEWGTHRDNMIDQYRHGTRIASEWHPNSVLTVEMVQWIRESTQKAPTLARALGVHPKTIYRARGQDQRPTYQALTRQELSGLVA